MISEEIQRFNDIEIIQKLFLELLELVEMEFQLHGLMILQQVEEKKVVHEIQQAETLEEQVEKVEIAGVHVVVAGLREMLDLLQVEKMVELVVVECEETFDEVEIKFEDEVVDEVELEDSEMVEIDDIEQQVDEALDHGLIDDEVVEVVEILDFGELVELDDKVELDDQQQLDDTVEMVETDTIEEMVELEELQQDNHDGIQITVELVEMVEDEFIHDEEVENLDIDADDDKFDEMVEMQSQTSIDYQSMQDAFLELVAFVQIDDMVETEQVQAKHETDTIGELEEMVETELIEEESYMLICTELQKQSTSADELEENEVAENIIIAELKTEQTEQLEIHDGKSFTLFEQIQQYQNSLSNKILKTKQY